MYKTIRHGENSLQYTILPQNDDFRMDGKLTNNSSSSNTNSNNNNKPKKGRRRSFFAYLGLLFVCTVIIGAILIPFLVSAECLPNPSDWFVRTKIAEREKNFIFTKNINNNNKTESTIKAYPDNNQNTETSESPLSTVNLNDEILSSEKIFTLPILRERNQNVNNMKKSDGSSDSDDGGPWSDLNNTDVPTITIKTIFPNNKMETFPRTSFITATTTTATTSTSTTTTTTPSITATTSTLSSSMLIISSKKPIILPVLAKTNSVIKENGKLVDRHIEPKNWIRSHWPFIDPSTYFQWAGYKSEVLPAILGVSLIAMILIVTLCLVARNKKTIVASVRKRNRNDIEEAGEDNTTLLTTGNQSDDD